jgi:hypothetical protein
MKERCDRIKEDDELIRLIVSDKMAQEAEQE